MKSKLIRALVALGVTAMTIGGLATPASSLPAPPATATLDADSRSALAGTTGKVFNLTISHPVVGLALGNINAVRIITDPDVFEIQNGDNNNGWTPTVSAEKDVILFEAAPGGGIPGNATGTLTFVANTLRPAADETVVLSVSTSVDGGTSYTPATAGAANGLATLVRTLDITSVTVSGPSFATDGAVTAGQTGIAVQTIVRNEGGVAQSVTSSLANDKGPESAAITTTIAPQTSEPYNFTVGMDNAAATATATLLGSATAAGSTASTESTTLSVKAPLDGLYVNNSLAPRNAVPGASPGPAFSVAFNPSGDVAATITRATLHLVKDVGGGGPVTIVQENDIAVTNAGADPDITISFPATVIPLALNDGTWTTHELIVESTDENSFTRSVSKVVGNPVVLDRLAPAVTPAIAVPARKVGDTDAATNGSQLTWSGQITDTNPATGAAVNCTTCTLDSAALEEYAGASLVTTKSLTIGTDISVSATGALTGTYVHTWNPSTTSAKLMVVVEDATGNPSGEQRSSAVAVDTAVPFIAGGTTGGPNADLPDYLRTINVDFSEAVIILTPAGAESRSFAAGDWTCTGDSGALTVLSATMNMDNLGATLKVDKELGRDELPQCQYENPTSPRLQDRVGLTVPNAIAGLDDGIVPGEVVITKVDGRDAVDGTFYSGLQSPTVTVTEILAGYTVNVYEDLDNDGVRDATDPLVGTAFADGTTEDIALNQGGGLGSTSRSLSLLTEAVDDTLNAGAVSAYALTLDFTAPALATATITRGAGAVDSMNIVIDLGEAVFGDGIASDWLVYSNNQAYNVGQVSISGTKVTLTVADTNLSPTTVLNKVRYRVIHATTRLEDIAGNTLGDALQAF